MLKMRVKIHTLPSFKFADPATYLTECEHKSGVLNVFKLRHSHVRFVVKRYTVPTGQDSGMRRNDLHNEVR